MGSIAAWLADVPNPSTLGLITVFLFLLFPHGRLEVGAGRRVAIVAVAGILLTTAGSIDEPTLQEHSTVPAYQLRAGSREAPPRSDPGPGVRAAVSGPNTMDQLAGVDASLGTGIT